MSNNRNFSVESMRFVEGLKKIFSQKLFAFIFLAYIVCYILLMVGINFLSNSLIIGITFYAIGTLVAFTTVLFVFSILIAVEDMKLVLIIIVAIITVPLAIVYSFYFALFYFFALLTNHLLTAIFVFNFGIETSQGFDNTLYKKKGSRNFTRALEFIFFGILTIILMYFTWTYLFSFEPLLADTFYIIIWIDLAIIVIVLLKLLFTKKFAGYITLFFFLAFLYVLYIVAVALKDILFLGGGFTLFSLVIDLFLFIYMMGAIFGRVDFIKEKIKIIRGDTIALFVMVMKLLYGSLVLDVLPPLQPAQSIILFWWLLILSVGFTFLFGFFSVLLHKEGGKKR